MVSLGLGKVYTLGVLLLITMILLPMVAAQYSTLTYTKWANISGVIENDRIDYMNADGNPLKEDIANYRFVGYMKSAYLEVTNYGTISKFNYTRSGQPPYRWLPLIEDTPGPSFVNTPVEGWAIAYNLTLYPRATFARDSGYLAVTLSGWDGSAWRLNVIGRDANDNWVFENVIREVLVNNPRLWVGAFNITVRNDGSTYKPKFNIEIRIIFNKATKFVEVYQRAKLVGMALPPGCYALSMEMALSRMAILDANPYCDRAFYGWKNVTISDPEFFMVLSWTNSTLDKWVRPTLGYNHHAVYMVSYPIPDSWAIASTWYDGPDSATTIDAIDIWSASTAWMLKWTPYNKYVYLNMGDIDGDGKGDGDQALIRVEWYASTPGIVLPEQLELEIDWKLVMYGLYDVNGTKYDGGEGGVFRGGGIRLSNGVSRTGPVTTWTHTGTLGWLNGLNEITSERLSKVITRLDLDESGTIEENEDWNEVDFKVYWYPEDELINQLQYKFAPPTFEKIVEEQWFTFVALPAPGATPDAAGSAMLTLRIHVFLALFDVEAYNLSATIGYVNPGTKMLPYLMLRLEPIPLAVEDYQARKSHYLTPDKRSFMQMVYYTHISIISVAGYHPNLVTYYFIDFSPIFRIIGGPYTADYIVLPTGPVIGHTPYAGTELGLGVISLARDHFGNLALLVYGLDAQDTYWAAFVASYYLDWIVNNYPDAQAILLRIDYTATGPTWGDGNGIPILRPTWPTITVIAASTEYEVKTLTENELPIPMP